jgi:hypothetical protein
MPEAEVVQSGALTDSPRLKELHALLSKGAAKGSALIEEEQVKADPLVQEKVGDESLSKRAALTMVKQAPEDDLEVFDQAMHTAGINPAIYSQLVEDPNYYKLAKEIRRAYQVEPAMAEITAAMISRARAGDTRAANITPSACSTRRMRWWGRRSPTWRGVFAG